MPAKKKTATKAKVKMKDMKARKNPKGGMGHKLDAALKGPPNHKFKW